jgi:hypothetical protein
VPKEFQERCEGRSQGSEHRKALPADSRDEGSKKESYTLKYEKSSNDIIRNFPKPHHKSRVK